MLDRSTPPLFQKIENVDIQQAQTTILDNTINLHQLSTGKQDLLRIELLFNAGTSNEQKQSVAYFTAKMLGEGTNHYSSKAISEYIDQYGAFIDIQNGLDRLNITIYVLNKFFEQILVILKEIVSDCIFPQKELDTLKQITLQNLKINLEKNAYIASREFRGILYNGSPYGKKLKEASINQIEREDLINHYQNYILNSLSEIFVTGKVTDKEINLINQYFGQLQVSNNTPKNNLDIKKPSHNKFYFEKEKSLQSSIRIGKSLFQKNHQDYFKFQVVNEIFGGYFGSRLMQNIREDKGFTYGIYSSIIHFQQASHLVISTDVKKEFRQATIDEIHKEAKKLRKEKVSESELEKVKNYILGSFASSVSNAFDLMDLYKGIYFFDLDYSFYDNYISAIHQTTSEDILNLSQKHLDVENMLEVVVG